MPEENGFTLYPRERGSEFTCCDTGVFCFETVESLSQFIKDNFEPRLTHELR